MKRSLGLGLALLVATPLLAQSAESDPKTATEHVVKPGETLGGIASRAEVPRVLIIEANGLKPPYLVKAGQKLVIPRRRSHTVKEGETGLSIALDYGVPWSAIALASGIDPKAPIKPKQKLTIPTMTKAAVAVPVATPTPGPAATPTPSASAPPSPALPPDTAKAPPFAWPYKGAILRDFNARAGKKAFHDGIDIAGKKDEAVRAAAAGKVIFAGQGPKEYGLTVIVYHSGRWTTTYAFLDKITVKEGEKVKAGERLGKLGQTGLAKEPSLHFEVRRNRVALDPLKHLPKAEADGD